MTVAEAKRRKRARRWLHNYIRAVDGDKDDPGSSRPGIQRRMWEKWCCRNGVDEMPFAAEGGAS